MPRGFNSVAATSSQGAEADDAAAATAAAAAIPAPVAGASRSKSLPPLEALPDAASAAAAAAAFAEEEKWWTPTAYVGKKPAREAAAERALCFLGHAIRASDGGKSAISALQELLQQRSPTTGCRPEHMYQIETRWRGKQRFQARVVLAEEFELPSANAAAAAAAMPLLAHPAAGLPPAPPAPDQFDEVDASDDADAKENDAEENDAEEEENDDEEENGEDEGEEEGASGDETLEQAESEERLSRVAAGKRKRTDDYSSMKYRELQIECKKRKLKATGTKKVLLARLQPQGAAAAVGAAAAPVAPAVPASTVEEIVDPDSDPDEAEKHYSAHPELYDDDTGERIPLVGEPYPTIFFSDRRKILAARAARSAASAPFPPSVCIFCDETKIELDCACGVVLCRGCMMEHGDGIASDMCERHEEIVCIECPRTCGCTHGVYNEE